MKWLTVFPWGKAEKEEVKKLEEEGKKATSPGFYPETA